jgi:formylglycine-generating enzyme required for sulfatase activity/serine/threonine protein kinase
MTTQLQPHDPLGIVGTTVAEKYRIIAVAGDGGFSVVYEAEHLIWQQRVAIKFFNVLEDADRRMREKLLNDFIQEGKIMSDLSSKSAAIVQARDIGKLARPNGEWIPYMVLEWIDGTPLDLLIKSEQMAGMKPRSLAEAMQLLDSVVVALDVAHKAGVAHRDLKPANVMVMGDGRDPGSSVKLLDFGIAKVMSEHEELGQQLEMTGHHITAFTPNYGAPEQFSRNYGATGPWTDVFALALILLEVIRGGERVLEGDSFYELGLSSCNTQTRPTPQMLGLELSVEIDRAFYRALEVLPKARFATVGEFWAELYRLAFPGQNPWSSTKQFKSVPDGMAAMAMAQASPGGPLTQATPLGSSSGRTALFIGIGVGVLAIGGAGAGVLLLGSEQAETTAPTASASVTATASASAVPLLQWDGACPKGMKVVNGAKFDMGSDDDGFPLWKPAHTVTLDTYCLDVHEVTVAKYRACVERGGCMAADSRPSFPKGQDESEEDHEKLLGSFAQLCNGDKSDRDDHPINCVDWNRANSYCQHLGARLPTEAEWELAARGGDGRMFPWGDDAGDHTYMNAAGTEWRRWLSEHGLPAPQSVMYEADDGFAGTAPVGRFPRAQTQSGQLDMVGNVWEWTSDWYALYKPDEQDNPKGPAAGDRKAIRGGGFNGEIVLWINPAARYHQLATASVHAVGFRCASNVRQNE